MSTHNRHDRKKFTKPGRPSARQRGYTSKWDKVRADYLASNPLCVMCQATGLVTVATVVDHIQPHKGDQALFWNRSNWQALCKPHHDRDKQRIDRGGKPKPTIGIDGWPLE